MGSNGKLVVGIGLPGSGKTSILSVAAQMLGSKSYIEPEECDWDRAVMQREQYGRIGALHWFRSQRVPNLVDARRLADTGETVFLDTFYDKICVHYLGAPGMEWLIERDDPYFNNFVNTAEIDYQLLPDADVLVYFNVTKEDWEKMLSSRGRQLDGLVRVMDTYHTTEHFRGAAERYCADRGAHFVDFSNKFSTVNQSAANLVGELERVL